MPILAILICAPLLFHAEEDFVTPRFAPPVPLTAAGEVIDVTTGHAAPNIHDFDGDGIQDLLVGEFGIHPFKGETTGKSSAGHPWVAGKLRFYRNHGTNTRPVYESFSYVKAGDRDAQVPITCCVSFVPQFIDFNADGLEDMISGSYPGDIYFFPGNDRGGFDEPIMQRDVNGDVVHARNEHGGELHDVHSITAELHDMDADGDLDLVIGSRLNGCFQIENVGTPREPAWSAHTDRLKTTEGRKIGGWDYGSNVHFTDWDDDGISDIVVGSEGGGIFWHQNLGTEHAPEFGVMHTLVAEQPMDERFLRLATPMRPSSRVKVHVIDQDGDGLNDLLVGDFGSRWTRVRRLTAEELAKKNRLERQLDALQEEMEADSEGLKTNAERSAHYDSFSDRIDPLYEQIESFETHEYESTGYVWFYRQLPADQGTEAANDSLKNESQSTVTVMTHGSGLKAGKPFPVTLAVHVPEGWTVCGNQSAMKAAGSESLPTKIEWSLPKGCSVENVTWQDPDEHALYEDTFAIEATIDTGKLDDSGDSTIGVEVTYQRCDKKSGVCILERERVEIPVTLAPAG
jgi:hypothetical protein